MKIVLSLLILICIFGSVSASVYNVGPNYTYQTLTSVPWRSLSPGDDVVIHGLPAGAAYHESILISASGTAAAPIVVEGVPNADGTPAIIDGTNATQSPGIAFTAPSVLCNLGLVQVDQYINCPSNYVPSYITIKNLTIQNAYQTNNLTIYSGKVEPWYSFCAGIYSTGAQNLTIQGCTLRGNGLGVFINTRGPNQPSKNILLDGNSIYGNGVVDSSGEHNVYVESEGAIYQNNYFGPLRAGAHGCNIKDRSSGTVIRYNYIGPGGHCIDLVETQGGVGAIDVQPDYKQTFVYGNIIDNEGASASATIVHFGGDQWNYQHYRHGTLYFYNNTVINIGDETGTSPGARYNTTLFCLPSEAESGNGPVLESVDCRNNILYNAPATSIASNFGLVTSAGSLVLGANWISTKKTVVYIPPYDLCTSLHLSGQENLFSGDINGANNPGFNSQATGDLSLSASSPCIDQGGPLASVVSALSPAFNVLNEYTPSNYLAAISVARPTNSYGTELGAYGSAVGASKAKSLPTVSIGNASTNYYYPNGTTLIFGIHLSNPSAGLVTVTAYTADGTAKAGKDYTATKTVITIPAGAQSATFSVPILSEVSTNLTRVFSVQLSNPTGATITPGEGTGTGSVIGFVPVGTQITPNGGSVPNGQLVTLSTLIPGSTIYYTLNGSVPVPSGPATLVYNAPFTLTSSGTVTAVATYPGIAGVYSSNAAVFTVPPPPPPALPAPTISPVGGVYTRYPTITITATPGAVVYYTTNGKPPTTASTVYTTPFLYTGGTIEAMATCAGYTNSAVVSQVFTVRIEAVSLSFPSHSVVSGSTITGTVALNYPATTVMILSVGGTPSGPLTLTNVTFPVGAQTEPITIKANAVTANKVVTVSAGSYGQFDPYPSTVITVMPK